MVVGEGSEGEDVRAPAKASVAVEEVLVEVEEGEANVDVIWPFAMICPLREFIFMPAPLSQHSMLSRPQQ